MTALYSAALALVLIIGLPYWLAVMLVSGKYREGLSERLGFIPARLKPFVNTPGVTGTVWLHAVSVGEVLAAAPLILRLREALARTHPQLRVVISTTTRTGQQLARDRFGANSVFYFPLDFRWILRRYLRLLRPQLLVLVETEFWPNYLTVAAQQRIPVAVVNARISDRSYPRYLRLRRIWKKLLASVTIFLAQSPLDAERLREIGALPDRIHVSGNLKYDLPPEPTTELPIISLLRAHLPDGAPVLVCGSTRDGEEAVILRAHAAALAQLPQLVTILAPRHPERFDTVAALLPDSRIRRSQWLESPAAIPPGSVFLLDSIGELARVYSVASIAFIGASLAAPGGGQNPLEPARFGIPILAGPYMQNFRDITTELEQAGALTRVTGESLATELTAALLNPDARGRQASAVVEANSGATGQTLTALLALLEPRP